VGGFLPIITHVEVELGCDNNCIQEGFLRCQTPTSTVRLKVEGCRVKNGGCMIKSEGWVKGGGGIINLFKIEE
jgi:hypothetical protein